MNCNYTGYMALFVLQLAVVFQLQANPYPVVSHIGIQQGLSNNSVRCIYQDHKGLLWFGTYDGLNRYDGYGFRVFRNTLNDTASIPHNYIYGIAEDRRHNLWIGTGQGVAVYNGLFDRFSPAYYYPFRTAQKEKINFNVSAVKVDAAGNVFISSNGWGLLFKKEGQEVAAQIPIRRNGEETTWYNVQSMCVDTKGKLWLFISELGLCSFDYQRQSIQPVNRSLLFASSLEPDDAGNIWIGSPNGLYKYVIASNTFAAHFTHENGHLPANNVVSLCKDRQKNIWIGTLGGGASMLNTVTQTFRHLLPGEDKHHLSSESVNAILVDRESRVWMGTLKGGINILDAHKSRFQTINHEPAYANSLINNFVASFFEDKEGRLWIGTDGGGFSIWNRGTNRFTNYRHDPSDSRSLSYNSVSCIRQDHRQQIWLATFGGGINKFDPASGRFEHYKCINTQTGEENKNVWLLYEDRQKNLWATTFGNGRLYRFNRQNNHFELFDTQLNDLISITEDGKGNLWAGDSHQLILIDRQQKKHRSFEIGKPVRAIYEDRHANLWLGTEGGGLILFNTKTGQIAARYATADGLTNNAVLNILEDNEGNLWVSTFNGLSKFNPSTKNYKNFYQSDGLQSNQFSYNAALRLHTGELAFGGINGFNLFDPRQVISRNYMPDILFSGIWVNNKHISDVAGYMVKTSEDRIVELRVPFNEAVLSFHFTALEYSSPEKISYAYFLEGWDKTWNYTGNVRTIYYNNISEGNYLLRVRSTNAEGVWNTSEATVKIIVLPPWYRSWWAWVLYVSVAASVIYMYFRYRARQAKLEYEIRLAHIDAEKEKEINEKRHSFFTNISHEFRTPLTLIINPVKDLLRKGDMTDAEKELGVVYRNAKRLLSLVDQLLIFRKADVEADKMQFARLNFSELCKEVYLCFVQQAKANQQTYVFECDDPGLELYVDREKMEIVLYNLISNAIKFTPAGGSIIFSVKDTGDDITLAVKDTGYGIPEAAAAKLFDKFYQATATRMPVKPGFGIGLYLVRHFVEGHKGTVHFESSEGAGATFFIHLQKGRGHLNGQVILEETQGKPVFLEELTEETAPVETTADTREVKLEELVTDRYTVLIVDDDAAIRQYLQQSLHPKYDVLEAANGKDAWQIVQKQFPDLVISDIRMDGMDGIELCKKIRKDPALNIIPVILLTGNTANETELQSIEQGADLYITKPFDKSILLARVEQIFKTRQEMRNYFFNEITLKQHGLRISAEYKQFLDSCIAIVERHLNDEQFTIKVLAREIGMSHSNLYKRIRLLSGQSVSNFIRYIRLRKAAELMLKNECNVNQAAFQVGISDIKYFREHFNKLFGMNPSDYIKKYRQPFNDQFHLSSQVNRNKPK